MEDGKTSKDLKADIQKAREEIYTKAVKDSETVANSIPTDRAQWQTPPLPPPNYKSNEKGNTCGIIGLCLGWFIPLAGIILGIIALSRKEKTTALGVLSICVAVFFWIFVWMPYFASH